MSGRLCSRSVGSNARDVAHLFSGVDRKSGQGTLLHLLLSAVEFKKYPQMLNCFGNIDDGILIPVMVLIIIRTFMYKLLEIPDFESST